MMVETSTEKSNDIDSYLDNVFNNNYLNGYDSFVNDTSDIQLKSTWKRRYCLGVSHFIYLDGGKQMELSI